MGVSRSLVVLVGVAALSCAAPPNRTLGPAVSVPPAAPSSSELRLPPGAWFQPNGSIIAVDASGRKSPELSAPLVPCMPALNKNGFYPPVREEQERMADEASLTFPYFLDACAGHYSIVKPAAGRSLTPEEARNNYRNVARCTFETHYGKPYWVPQLIQDVDLCERVLGPEWRLPTSESLSRFNTEHRGLIHAALKDVPHGGGYDSLLVYARAEQRLMLLELAPVGARQESLPRLPVPPGKSSFQAPGVSLRCVRQAQPFPATDSAPVSPLAASCGATFSASLSAPPPAAARPQPKFETEIALDPVLQRLAAHAQALREKPESFNPELTRRELERALRAAKKARLEGANTQELARAEAAPLMLRYQELRRRLEDPTTPAGERPQLLQELRNVKLSLAPVIQRLMVRETTRERAAVDDALRIISSLNQAAYSRAFAEYKHWVVVGKPAAGSHRSLAAVEAEVRALKNLQQKMDEITGNEGSKRFVLPPRSAFKKD